MELIHSEDASKLNFHNPETVSALIYQWLLMLGLRVLLVFCSHSSLNVSGYDENQQGSEFDGPGLETT